MYKWCAETIFLVKLEAEQNIVFQNYVRCIQQIVKTYALCRHRTGPYPKLGICQAKTSSVGLQFRDF